ncbi:hypothetical protein V2A60_002345 [Cordyceps javanica]
MWIPRHNPAQSKHPGPTPAPTIQLDGDNHPTGTVTTKRQPWRKRKKLSGSRGRSSSNGAIGCLFRLTVTGFGYTLVAKGVQSFHAHRLYHEDVIYKKLAAQQGILIPMCLGVVKLRLPYPMTNGKLVTDMLLLSYAGTPLYSPSLHRRLEARRVDVDAEACRTLGELQALGVEDEDDTSNGNLTWCESVGRVMKIDFDHPPLSSVRLLDRNAVAPRDDPDQLLTLLPALYRKESGDLAAAGQHVTARVEEELDLRRPTNIQGWLCVAKATTI